MKITKKLAGLLITGVILATGIASANAASYNYNGQFNKGLWTQSSFGFDGTQYIMATQKPQYAGQPCGVQYQIRTDNWVVSDTIHKSVNVWGAATNKYVNMDGVFGNKKVYFQNLYSDSYWQYVNGTVNW